MAKRLPVAYGSKYGSTAEIAEAIGTTLVEAGLDAEVKPAGEAKALDSYDAVVLGSAVYMGRWRREAARLLRRRRRELAERDVWLFSSGPVGEEGSVEDDNRWIRPRPVERAAAAIHAREHVVFGGRVSEDVGGFVRRNMAKSSPPELRDRRDWDRIRAWAEEIAAVLGSDGLAGSTRE